MAGQLMDLVGQHGMGETAKAGRISRRRIERDDLERTSESLTQRRETLRGSCPVGGESETECTQIPAYGATVNDIELAVGQPGIAALARHEWDGRGGLTPHRGPHTAI